MDIPDFILPVIYSILLSLAIYKSRFFQLTGLPRYFPTLAFLLKIAAGLFLYFLYTNYYTDRFRADIFRFYDDALLIWQDGKVNWTDYLSMLTGIADYRSSTEDVYQAMNNWYNASDLPVAGNSRILIRFHALALLFSGGNYHVHYILMSFLSFSGAIMLWKAFQKIDPRHSLISFALIFLIPSTLLWTSGVLKESLIFLAIGMLFYGMVQWRENSNKIKSLILLFFGLALMLATRPYIGMVIIAFLPVLLLPKHPGFRSKLLGTVIYAIAALVFVTGINLLSDINVSTILADKQQSFHDLVSQTNPGNLVPVPQIGNTTFDLIWVLPLGFLNALIHPNFLNSNSLFEWLSFIEIVFLMVLILLLVFRFQKPGNPSFWLFSICTLFVCLAIIGIVVPNAGAIVRYRSVFLPILMLAALHSSSYTFPLMQRFDRMMPQKHETTKEHKREFNLETPGKEYKKIVNYFSVLVF